MTLPNSLRQQPDATGHFGDYGGRYEIGRAHV